MITFFIYKFELNLNFNHVSYFERYIQNHNFFDPNKKGWYGLNLVI